MIPYTINPLVDSSQVRFISSLVDVGRLCSEGPTVQYYVRELDQVMTADEIRALYFDNQCNHYLRSVK